MYFEKFPTILHSYPGKTGRDILVILKDITRNVRVRKEVLGNISLYDTYDLVDGETPEIIAEKVYGSAEYNWVVMLLNEKFDYASDFPLSQDALATLVTKKYGAGNEYSLHHYENAQGFVVMSDATGAVAVTNYDYEDRINEQKRKIKLIAPELLSTIIDNFEQLMA